MVRLQAGYNRGRNGELLERYFITVPKAMVEAKGWKKGTELAWMFNERGELVLVEADRRARR